KVRRPPDLSDRPRSSSFPGQQASARERRGAHTLSVSAAIVGSGTRRDDFNDQARRAQSWFDRVSLKIREASEQDSQGNCLMAQLWGGCHDQATVDDLPPLAIVVHEQQGRVRELGVDLHWQIKFRMERETTEFRKGTAAC